jgi:hypothetical protein
LVVEATEEVTTAVAVVLAALVVVYWEWVLVSSLGFSIVGSADVCGLSHGTSSKDNNQERRDTHIERFGR